MNACLLKKFRYVRLNCIQKTKFFAGIRIEKIYFVQEEKSNSSYLLLDEN